MKPNILFICIDGLRADRCFSDEKTAKTPHLDSLINKGLSFDQTITSADQTGISLSSIFTSKFPIK